MAKIGERIGTYEITRLLGSGGMAMVYAARHTSIGTDHALKILLPNYANNPRTVERFRQEARAQFRMRHPNIVQVTDFVDDGENLALVMDLVAGMTLAEAMRLRPGPWAVADVVAVMRPVLEAMTYAHREGLDGAAVVHRDLKPENVMLDLSGERSWPGVPKVMDFGIAKVLGVSNAATATNARMGTPGYMSPEQFKSAKDAGAPADVWALGVMLWQLLAGRLPVDPEDNFAMLDLYRGAIAIPLLTEVVAGVPKGLSEAVAQALALDPRDRFADAGPLLRAVGVGAVERGAVVVHRQVSMAIVPKEAPKPELADGDLPPPLPYLQVRLPVAPELPGLPNWPVSGGDSGKSGAISPRPDAVVSTGARPPSIGLLAIIVVVVMVAMFGVGRVLGNLNGDPEVEAGGQALALTVPNGMALIPAYSFKMGCVPDDPKCQEDEKPQHDVDLSAFYMDVYEVTVAKYKACVDAGACTAPSSLARTCNWGRVDKEQHPVNCVTWSQSEAFCSWAGSRLPTEAEWEKASRGGDEDKLYPWGNLEPTCSRGLSNTVVWSGTAGIPGCGQDSTAAVGSGSSKNSFGLYDMSGNVWEWVADWYGVNYYLAPVLRNPQGPGSRFTRVFRGGSFYSRNPSDLRSSSRADFNPLAGYDYLGFRCAKSAP